MKAHALTSTQAAVLDGLLRAEEMRIRYTATVLPSTWRVLVVREYVTDTHRLTPKGRTYATAAREERERLRERMSA